MAESTTSNGLILPYPLHRVVLNPNTQTITVYAGMLFPRNGSIKLCIFYFGETKTPYYLEPTAQDKYDSMVSAVSGYTSFLPNWGDDTTSNAGVTVPKFTGTYSYKNPGTYRIMCVLVDENGTVYEGAPTKITIPSRRAPYVNYWDTLSEYYTPTINSGKTFPIITTNYTTSVSADLPFTAAFSIQNLTGRTDIEYIHWKFNNNTEYTVAYNSVTNVPTVSTIYPLLPVSEQIRASVTIAYRNGQDRLAFRLNSGRSIQNIGNISVSKSITDKIGIDALLEEGEGIAGTDIATLNEIEGDSLYDICAIPAASSTLPVTTRFYFKHLPDLKLILCDFDDGSYDVVPVAVNPLQENVRTQYSYTGHRYSAVNNTDFYPVFIYLFEREDGTFYAQRRTLRSRLRYSVGVFEQNGNHRLIPITSSTNFRKLNGISTTVTYGPSANKATVTARLSIGTNSKHILSFDKIIWNVNGTGIVQDKNVAQQFGYIYLPVNVPYSKYKITASLYRKSLAGPLLDEFYAFYDNGVFNILTKEASDEQNIRLKLISQQQELDPSIRLVESEDVLRELPERLTREIEEEEYLQELSPEARYAGTQLMFDKAITAEAPAANFLNRNYPTIATNETQQFSTKESVGFFKPSKVSLTIVDPGQYTFYLNVPAVETSKPYYFPDPYKYGSETTALLFDVDNTSFKKGIDFGYLKNLPNTTDTSILFNGYTSLNKQNVGSRFISLLSGGYVADSKEDVFGNTYTLVKPSDHYKQNITTLPSDIREYVNVNGYVLYDIIFNSGSSYNYNLTGYIGNILQTGITTQTATLTANNKRYTTLNFGKLLKEYSFIPTKQPISITTQYFMPISAEEISCGVFSNPYTGSVDDYMSSDLSAFPIDGYYYYAELFEAGTHSSSPYQRPLLDNTDAVTQATTAIFTESLFLSNSGDVLDVDCGMFYTKYNINNDKIIHATDTNIFSISSTTSTTEFTAISATPASIIKRKKTTGHLLITNNYGRTGRLMDLKFNKQRYGTTVFDELSGIHNFDVLYDKYFIQTNNYLIIDKINYKSGRFVKSTTTKNVLKYNNDAFNKISNRFKIDNYVYFTITKRLVTSEIREMYIMPYVYRYNINTNKLHLLYPRPDVPEIDERLNVTDEDVVFTEVASPRICFSRRTNKINLSYLLKDQNKSPSIVSIMFSHSNFISFSEAVTTKITKSSSTVMFVESEHYSAPTTPPPTRSFTTLLSSNTPLFTDTCLIL
jgi:hypothetical protein